MSYWFEKNGMRRFRRVDMPVGLSIVPRQPLRSSELQTYGIDYFPPSMEKRIQQAQKHLHYWINHIQEQKEVLIPVFANFERYGRYFGSWVASVSLQARSPRSDVATWLEFHAHAKGVQSLEELAEQAPKTFRYFDLLNVKLQSYFRHFGQCLDKSTASHFDLSEKRPRDFEVDALAKKLAASVSKEPKVPLVQALYYLLVYMSYYFRAYDEMIQDLTPVSTPSRWTKREVNLSAGGLSLLVDKRYPANTRFDIGLFFPETQHLIDFEAALVRSTTMSRIYRESNAFNFNFPDGYYQKMVIYEIERYEIRSSMDVMGLNP
ncbi:MAG: hypothetical protein ACP5D0_08935 [Hydrogenovibrio sp.]